MAAKKKAPAKAAAPRKAAKPEAPVFQQVFKTVDDLLRKDAGCNIRTRLHRAVFMAVVPQVPRRIRAGPRARSQARRTRNTSTSSTRSIGGAPGQHLVMLKAQLITTPHLRAKISLSSSTANSSHTSKASNNVPRALTPLNTKSAKSSTKFATACQAATTFEDIIDQ
jgi:hypothetical protein